MASKSFSSKVFEDMLIRGAAQIDPPLSGTIYLIVHEYMSGAYLLQKDFENWDKIKQWLRESCVNEFRVIGSTQIAFQCIDDAMMFKLTHGGIIVEKNLED